jgi:hypothetical protein
VVSDNDLTTEGEVDIFIRKKPTIAELAAVERQREKESGFVIESSGSEGESEVTTPKPKDSSRLTKNATIIHSGYFYKQGQVRKNWKQRYFELWSRPVPSPALPSPSSLLTTLLFQLPFLPDTQVHRGAVVQRGQ